MLYQHHMRVLAFADRNPADGTVLDLIADSNPDLIVLLGDLDAWSLQDLKRVNIPKIGVYGNHCMGDYLPDLGAVNAHGRTLKGLGIRIAGLGGCPRYKAWGENQYHEDEAAAIVSHLRRADLVITHCPPFEVNDDPQDPVHAGWRCLRAYVERTKPKYLLHGHTYPNSESLTTRSGATEIRYVFGSSSLVLDLPTRA
jgi:hypothetical protein